jgi:hypothetical protein
MNKSETALKRYVWYMLFWGKYEVIISVNYDVIHMKQSFQNERYNWNL